MAPAHPFLASTDARSLHELVCKIGYSWIQGTKSCTEVDGLFDALQTVVSGALSTLATKWNDNHDRLRILPHELRDLCLFSLPAADKCQLGSVCSFWRDGLANSSFLWTEIMLPDGVGPLNLAALIQRSGQLPFRLAVAVSSNRALESVSSALQPHAHRLQALEIDLAVRLISAFMTPVSAFEYPAPMLRLLSLKWNAPRHLVTRYQVSSNLFNGVAPRLRSVVLERIHLPTTCPAFSAVPYASLRGLDGASIFNVFPIFPSLRQLDPLSVLGPALPPLPAHHGVEEVSLYSMRPTLIELEGLGYMRLPRLTVVSECSAAILVQAVNALSAASEAALTVDASGQTELALRRDGGRRATFICRRLHEIRDELSNDAFRAVAHLVLPLHVISVHVGDDVGCPILRGRVQLPNLRALVIRCVPPNRFTLSLIDPDIPRGVFIAPILGRVDVIAESQCASDAPALSLAHLADFFEHHLALQNAASVELLIDTAHGVHLESYRDSDMARLRACVGVLHF